jgi:hypothetical protein
MSGTKRLPGGERLKASQRGARRALALPVEARVFWRIGDKVRWKDRAGIFHRDVGDGEHAEIAIAERVYRVRTSELG